MRFELFISICLFIYKGNMHSNKWLSNHECTTWERVGRFHGIKDFTTYRVERLYATPLRETRIEYNDNVKDTF